MVEAQAARTPEAIALRGADQAMTYGEMDRRANLIAERLRAAGVGRPFAQRRRYVAEVMGDLGTCEGQWERTCHMVRTLIGLPGLAWMLHRENRQDRA
jgi:non-ribosomal peptide synthetase component F